MSFEHVDQSVLIPGVGSSILEPSVTEMLLDRLPNQDSPSGQITDRLGQHLDLFSPEQDLLPRDLTEFDLDLITGSGNRSDITVTGDPWDWGDFNTFFFFLSADWGSGLGGGGGASEEPPPPEEEPDCDAHNPINGLTPADGAKYRVPEYVTRVYLDGALDYLSNYARSHTAVELLSEFNSMYSDPSHPHFIDFKDWGTANGPVGGQGAGTSTYYSPAAGTNITSSVFEPFGNWFYGFAGTWAGISPDVLYGAAALVQEGDTGWIPNDSPEDMPHVSAGILAAKNFKDNPGTVLSVEEGHCASGVTSKALGVPELVGQIDPDFAYHNPTYRQNLWSYIENRYLQTV